MEEVGSEVKLGRTDKTICAIIATLLLQGPADVGLIKGADQKVTTERINVNIHWSQTR